ncbi:MAG: redox-regulated ATPase YchF [Patescibacteria group bacterium]|jgi:hypothetical protein
MSLSIGIVGLPNVGKSTLFKALTKKQINIANYPFCTIEPNVGIVEVPDERLQKLSDAAKSAKIVPTVIEFVDIAGLVKGASVGEGLGNQFLANIREVDAIAQVVRNFTDPNIIIESGGKVDPASDIEVINTELALKDLETITKRVGDLERKIKSGVSKEDTKLLELVKKIKEKLGAGTMVNSLDLTDDEKSMIKEFNLLTAKPVMYILNVDEGAVKNPLPEIKGIDKNLILPISAKIEAELAELADEEKKEYLQTLGLEESGLDQLIKKGYETLDLITFLTSGPDETRAWTVQRGSFAPQAAGRIHTDFEKGFIRVEVCRWQDFVAYGETGCKEKGLLRIEGKDYVMQDGDVCHFRFSN